MDDSTIGGDELVVQLDEKFLAVSRVSQVASRVLNVVDVFSCLPG